MCSRSEFRAPDAAYEHCKQFEPVGITQITDGVYFALGYALANVVVLEGEESLVVVDTTESPGLARRVLADLRKLTQKPISDIIFTHYHGDHACGAEGFVEDAARPPRVWAHESMKEAATYAVSALPRLKAGITMQFGGISMPKEYPELMVNGGIGPNVLPMWRDPELAPTWHYTVSPTDYVTGYCNDVTMAGIPLKLLHLPGESPDHLCVWWEEKGVFCPGDNVYRCFPSLYPVRGAPPRDPLVWAGSLEKIAGLRPRYMCPGHSGAVCGEEEIQDILTVLIDGIHYVHDQTVRYTNRGLSPVEISQKVKLPPSMASHPYLQEHYAHIPWITRNIYAGYFGWFSGTDLLELSPLSAHERAPRLVTLAGKDKVMAEAEKAVEKGDLWWGIELTTHLLRTEEDESVRTLRERALYALAGQQLSSHARAAFLTYADRKWDVKQVTARFAKANLSQMPPLLFSILKTRVNPDVADTFTPVVVLTLKDKEKGGTFNFRFRHSVLSVGVGESEDWTIKVTCTTKAFQECLQQKEYKNYDISIQGNAKLFEQFITCFDL